MLAKKSPAGAAHQARSEREEKWRDAVSLMEKFPMLADDLKAMVKQDMANFLGFNSSPFGAPAPAIAPASIDISTAVEPSSAVDADEDVVRAPSVAVAIERPTVPSIARAQPPVRAPAAKAAPAAAAAVRVEDRPSIKRPRKRCRQRGPVGTRRFTAAQRDVLNEAFRENPFPDAQTIEELRAQLGVPHSSNPRRRCSVYLWFMTQRAYTKTQCGPAGRPSTVHWSPEQLNILRQTFQTTPYITSTRLSELRREFGVVAQAKNLCQITGWFQSERRRYRYQNKPLPNGVAWRLRGGAPGPSQNVDALAKDSDANRGSDDDGQDYSDLELDGVAIRGSRKRPAESSGDEEGPADEMATADAEHTPPRATKRPRHATVTSDTMEGADAGECQLETPTRVVHHGRPPLSGKPFVWSAEQRRVLDAAYQKNPYPSNSQVEKLREKLGGTLRFPSGGCRIISYFYLKRKAEER